MAALHPASTHRAASDPDSKAAHDRVHDRQSLPDTALPRGSASRGRCSGDTPSAPERGSPHRHAPVAVGDRGAHAVPRVGARGAAAPPSAGPSRRGRPGVCLPGAPGRVRASAGRSRGAAGRARVPTGHARVSSAPGPAANRSIRRSSSPTGSERSGTSRLCQIPAHCTSQECSVWRVRPGNQLRSARWGRRSPPYPRRPVPRQETWPRRCRGGRHRRPRARRPDLSLSQTLPGSAPVRATHPAPGGPAYPTAHALPRSHRSQNRRPRHESRRTRPRPPDATLSGMADVLDVRLHQAQTEQMAPIELVAALVADERQRRQTACSPAATSRPASATPTGHSTASTSPLTRR